VANFTALLKHRVYIGYTLCCSSIFASLFAFLSDAPFVLVVTLKYLRNTVGDYRRNTPVKQPKPAVSKAIAKYKPRVYPYQHSVSVGLL
ncbi:MAG: hypothetical protein QNK43_17085, partial [Amphritea sp.]|nr:hypothetical protein [Amphritea sp.]